MHCRAVLEAHLKLDIDKEFLWKSKQRMSKSISLGNKDGITCASRYSGGSIDEAMRPFVTSVRTTGDVIVESRNEVIARVASYVADSRVVLNRL
jgi:hypothetical protein